MKKALRRKMIEGRRVTPSPLPVIAVEETEKPVEKRVRPPKKAKVKHANK